MHVFNVFASKKRLVEAVFFTYITEQNVLYNLVTFSSELIVNLFLNVYFSIFECYHTRFLSLLDFILSHSVTGDISQVVTWQWVHGSL